MANKYTKPQKKVLITAETRKILDILERVISAPGQQVSQSAGSGLQPADPQQRAGIYAAFLRNLSVITGDPQGGA